MRKRLKGAPTSGMVSVVVTDVEDFSGAVDGWMMGVAYTASMVATGSLSHVFL